MKIVRFYYCSELVHLTTDTVEADLVRGNLVLIVLIFFLVSFRAAVIVALTIPLSLLFAFIVCTARRRRQSAIDWRDSTSASSSTAP